MEESASWAHGTGFANPFAGDARRGWIVIGSRSLVPVASGKFLSSRATCGGIVGDATPNMLRGVKHTRDGVSTKRLLGQWKSGLAGYIGRLTEMISIV